MEKICNLEMIRGVLPSEQLPIDPIHLLPSHLSFQTVSDPEHWIEASFPRLVTLILDVGLMSTQPTTASASHTKYNNTPLLYLLIQQIVLKVICKYADVLHVLISVPFWPLCERDNLKDGDYFNIVDCFIEYLNTRIVFNIK